eukprot:3781106-Prymnesium_polylepis.1
MKRLIRTSGSAEVSVPVEVASVVDSIVNSVVVSTVSTTCDKGVTSSEAGIPFTSVTKFDGNDPISIVSPTSRSWLPVVTNVAFATPFVVLIPLVAWYW